MKLKDLLFILGYGTPIDVIRIKQDGDNDIRSLVFSSSSGHTNLDFHILYSGELGTSEVISIEMRSREYDEYLLIKIN